MNKLILKQLKMDCNEIIKTLKSAEVSAHFWHLTTQYECEHRAFGAFYDAMGDHVDTAAEAWMALTGKRIDTPSMLEIVPYGKVKRHLDELQDALQEGIKFWEKNYALQDVLINAQSTVMALKYQLMLS